MAINLVESKFEVVSGTYGLAFTSTPTSGNLLIWILSIDKNPALTIPSGFTSIYNQTNDGVSFAAAYKVSDGTESGLLTGTTTLDRGGKLWIAEYENAAYNVASTAQYTNSNANSLSTGTTPTAHADGGLGIAIWCTDSCGNMTNGNWSWTSSYDTPTGERDTGVLNSPNGVCGMMVGTKTIAGSTTEETTGAAGGSHSDQIAAGIFTLYDTDAGPSSPTGTLAVTLADAAMSAAGTTGATILNFDGDDDVYPGQTPVTITCVGLPGAVSSWSATLGGEALTAIAWNSGQPTVGVPADIALLHDVDTYELALTWAV